MKMTPARANHVATAREMEATELARYALELEKRATALCGYVELEASRHVLRMYATCLREILPVEVPNDRT